MLWMLIELVLTATVLQILSAVIPRLEIDDWGTAFLAAFLVGLCGIPVFFLWGQLGVEVSLFRWQMYALLFAINTVALGVVSLVLSGMRVRGFLALLVAGIVLTALDAGLQLAPPLPLPF